MENRPAHIEGEGFRYGIKENHHRRLNGHDYSAPGTYMLTIVTEGNMHKTWFTTYPHTTTENQCPVETREIPL